jgi:hypothetical protein
MQYNQNYIIIKFNKLHIFNTGRAMHYGFPQLKTEFQY